ncbi:hypothetical protein [Nostoc sp.]
MGFFTCGNLIILSGLHQKRSRKLKHITYEYEVKPVKPFLILRHPGDYA